MKNYLKYLILLVIVFEFSEVNSQTMINEKLNIDNSKVVILEFKPNDYWIFKKATSIKLNNNEISKIEKTLHKIVENYNFDQRQKFKEYQTKNPNGTLKLSQLTIDLSNYKRQYIAVKNEKGEKEVWINMLCHDLLGKWQTEIVDVCDGGNCYFNFKINLTKNIYYELMFNGVA